jgi:hypothetical protein
VLQPGFLPRLAVPRTGELAVYGSFTDIADHLQPALALFRH